MRLKIAFALVSLFAPFAAFATTDSRTLNALNGDSHSDYYTITATAAVSFTTTWYSDGSAGGFFGVTGNGTTVYYGNYGAYLGNGSGSRSGSGPAGSYYVGQQASSNPGGYATVTTTATW